MRWWWTKRRERETDLERELEAHLELEAEEQASDGVSRSEARYAARRALGNSSNVKEDVREAWGWAKAEQLWSDVRFALRALRKSPAFACTAVLSLALGIGANTAIFTVVNAVLLRPLPFPDPEQLVNLWEARPAKSDFRNVINPLNFLDWQDRTHSFAAMSAFSVGTANLSKSGEPIALSAMQVSANFFSMLHIAPTLGRAFVPEEGQPGHGPVAILSSALWESQFGGDRSILGRQIMLNGASTTVVGVMPRGFTFPKIKAEIWIPLILERTPESSRGRYLQAMARLKPGASLQQAQEDLHQVARQLALERPDQDKGWSAEVYPMLADVTNNVRLPLLVLLAAVGLVLLIACANVANLLLMRAAGRTHEMGIRSALGASRSRLILQLLSESLVLGSAACALGLAIARAGVRALLSLIPNGAQMPRLDAIRMDWRVGLFAVVISLGSAMLFGLVPALQSSAAGPWQTVQSGSARTTAKGTLRQILVVIETALSLLLLIGAGLMLRSFYRLTAVNPGFETQHVLTMEVFTAPAKYHDDRTRARYFTRLLDEINAVPEVRAAGSTHFLPLQGRISGSCFGRADEPPPVPSVAPTAEFLVVTSGYFDAMRMPLIAGRMFDRRDYFESPDTVMVNAQFVKKFLTGRNPVGEKLNVCWTVKNPVEIVGVIADARQAELQRGPQPTIYINNLQSPMYFAQFAIRSSGDPQAMTRAVQAAIHRVDPDQAITHVATLNDVFSEAVAQPRFQLVLILIFGALAGLLALIGVYGVVSYSVAQRTREIGIRMALGAKPAQVRWAVLRNGIRLGIYGAAFGVAAALAFTRVLRTLLFETQPTDETTLVIVTSAVLLVVILATLIPAARAARLNPTITLRYE